MYIGVSFYGRIQLRTNTQLSAAFFLAYSYVQLRADVNFCSSRQSFAITVINFLCKKNACNIIVASEKTLDFVFKKICMCRVQLRTVVDSYVQLRNRSRPTRFDT